jgi:hypothetical protein
LQEMHRRPLKEGGEAGVRSARRMQREGKGGTVGWRAHVCGCTCAAREGTAGRGGATGERLWQWWHIRLVPAGGGEGRIRQTRNGGREAGGRVGSGGASPPAGSHRSASNKGPRVRACVPGAHACVYGVGCLPPGQPAGRWVC